MRDLTPNDALAHRRNTNTWVICALVVASAAHTATSLIALDHEVDVSQRSAAVWAVSFSVLIVLWAYNDSVVQGDRWKRDYPYFLLFILWPIVLLYHLVCTRRLKGVALYALFLAIYLAPYLIPYAYYSVLE